MSEDTLVSVLEQDWAGNAVEKHSHKYTNWASFDALTVQTGLPAYEHTRKKKVGYEKTGFLSRKAIYKDEVVSQPSTLKEYSVNGAPYSYNLFHHQYSINLENLRLTDQSGTAEFLSAKARAAAEAVKETAVSFWDAVQEMAKTALGRVATILLAPLVLAGVVMGVVNIPWSSINLIPLLTVLLYALGVVVAVALPSAIVAGILWLVTPSKIDTSIAYPSIRINHADVPWKGIQVDVERTQRETHKRLLPLMKKFAFRKALTVAVSFVTGIQFVAYIVIAGVFGFWGSMLVVTMISMVVSMLACIYMLTFGYENAMNANRDEAAEQLVLYVEQTDDMAVSAPVVVDTVEDGV